MKGGKWPFQLKANRDRNRPADKMPAEQLRAALAAHDRIMAVSTEIRARHGLEALPESDAVSSWRVRLVELETKAPARAKAPRTVALTVDEQLAELAKRRRRIDREQLEVRAEAVRMFKERLAGATKIGDALGVKRQRVYQLAEVA